MPDQSLLMRIQEFAQANGMAWRRNRNKIGLIFRDGLDEQRLDLASISRESLEGFLETFARLDKSRHFLLEAISKSILSRGGSVERKPSGWMITTGEGVGINDEFDWRFTRKLSTEDPDSILRQFLKSNRLDAMPSAMRPDPVLAGDETGAAVPTTVPDANQMMDALSAGVFQALSHIQAGADADPNHRQPTPEDQAKMASAMEAISSSMAAFVQDLTDLFPKESSNPNDPIEASRLWTDFEPRHEVKQEIKPLEPGCDLEWCDAWARKTIEEMRKSPHPKWYRDPLLWIPEIDQWMTDADWEIWAESELERDSSPWSPVTASILLRPGGKVHHRDSARRWAERWHKDYGHDSDCYEEILLPFIQEIEGLEECLDVTTWHSMVRAWNAGDLRWEKPLRDAVFAHDSMYLDHLIHPGMRRSFWDELFSPDDLDIIRHHLLDWSKREPGWELRYGFASYVHLALVMNWKDVLESVARRPFLSHHLGSLDLPVATLKENSRRLLEAFREHLDSLPGRDREDDRIAIDRLTSRLAKSIAHTDVSDALICTAVEAFRPYALPLFARAISRLNQWHAQETAFTDSWALAVGWSRLRPHETLGEAT
ncbi:MAG: hypothetical protein IPN71_12690 [Fibrobacteres bacterium]|nr:hypothetical protein [Fibrobacterota bacterium]